jgi:hypothetical protein
VFTSCRICTDAAEAPDSVRQDRDDQSHVVRIATANRTFVSALRSDYLLPFKDELHTDCCLTPAQTTTLLRVCRHLVTNGRIGDATLWATHQRWTAVVQESGELTVSKSYAFVPETSLDRRFLHDDTFTPGCARIKVRAPILQQEAGTLQLLTRMDGRWGRSTFVLSWYPNHPTKGFYLDAEATDSPCRNFCLGIAYMLAAAVEPKRDIAHMPLLVKWRPWQGPDGSSVPLTRHPVFVGVAKPGRDNVGKLTVLKALGVQLREGT